MGLRQAREVSSFEFFYIGNSSRSTRVGLRPCREAALSLLLEEYVAHFGGVHGGGGVLGHDYDEQQATLISDGPRRDRLGQCSRLSDHQG